MDLNKIQFPIEANVQNLAHFIDTQGNYAFTFASPYCYSTPAEMKEKSQRFLREAYYSL